MPSKKPKIGYPGAIMQAVAMAASMNGIPLRTKQNTNVFKECFREGCDNKRGERGLYCSPKCHALDNAKYDEKGKRLTVIGKTYRDRCDDQCEQWMLGNPIHNRVDDECCPDFSCCNSTMAPEEKRKEFWRVYTEEGPEAIVPLLGEFLGGMLSANGHEVETSEGVFQETETKAGRGGPESLHCPDLGIEIGPR